MYVCIYAHVCIWGCPYMCTYMWRPWVNVRCLPILFSTLVSETESLTESGARQLGKASWPVTLGSLLPLSPSTGMKGKATMPGFCMSAKRQNSVLRQQAFYRPSHLPCILLRCDRASHNQSQGLVAWLVRKRQASICLYKHAITSGLFLKEGFWDWIQDLRLAQQGPLPTEVSSCPTVCSYLKDRVRGLKR